MRLPKRAPSHIKETQSWKILQKEVPSKWIVREVSERDYGVDCYIELVSSENTVTGDLISVQLKGTENLEWKYNKKMARREANFSGLKIETLNYWMNLPVPVFLFVAEISSDKLFFSPIKHQVRNKYNKYTNQKSFSFTLSDQHSFSDDSGLLQFIICYIQEKNFRSFKELSRTLLIHLDQYHEFICMNQGLDPFIEIDQENELMFVHIYLTIHKICNVLAIDWDIKWLNEIYTEDKKTWKRSRNCLHNLTMTNILPQIESKLMEVLQIIRKIVTVNQKDYWKKEEYILYQKARELERFNKRFT